MAQLISKELWLWIAAVLACRLVCVQDRLRNDQDQLLRYQSTVYTLIHHIDSSAHKSSSPSVSLSLCVFVCVRTI